MPFVASSGQPKGLPASVYGNALVPNAQIAADTSFGPGNTFGILGIDAGVSVYFTDGIIYVNDTLRLDGTLYMRGANGGNGSTFNGGAGGSSTWNGIFGINANSNTGGNGQTGNGSPGATGVTQNTSMANASGDGGAGGMGSVLYSASGGSQLSNNTIIPYNMFALLGAPSYASSEANRLGGLHGGGGGGGSGDNTNKGGGGGGGGEGGGVLFVCARKITGTGTLRAKGGNGGNGANGSAGNTGGGGGGGGGAGGLIVVITDQISAVTKDVSGGTGGTGGTKTGSGTNGSNGSNGQTGVTIIYNRITDAYTVTGV